MNIDELVKELKARIDDYFKEAEGNESDTDK
jgi:hypothetical protein